MGVINKITSRFYSRKYMYMFSAYVEGVEIINEHYFCLFSPMSLMSAGLMSVSMIVCTI